jgi:hypothetical protein
MCAALAACQGQPPAEEPTGADESEQVESHSNDNPSNEGEGMTQGNADRMSLDEAVEAARRDLAERAGKAEGAISVVEARTATWRNGALGCPEEGMMYTQALVKGFYILLSDGEAEHAYHAGRDGKPFYCPADRSEPPLDSDPEQPLS